ARLAERVGLRLPATFSHRFREVGEEDRQPEPERDLQFEAESRLTVGRIDQQPQRRQHAPDLDHEHHGIPGHRSRMELADRVDNRGPHDRRIPDRSRLRVHLSSHQNTCPFAMSRCSTIGPRLRAGKNVSAPTMTMTPTSSAENSGVVTGNVPAEGGTRFLRPRLPAIASIGMIMKKRPIIIASASEMLYHFVFVVSPPKAEPLLPVLDVNA